MKAWILIICVIVGSSFTDDRLEGANLYVCFPKDHYYWPEVRSAGDMIKEDSSDSLTCLDIRYIDFYKFEEDGTGFLVKTDEGYEDDTNPNYLFLIENKPGERKNFGLINIFQNEGEVYRGPNSFPGYKYSFFKDKDGYLKVSRDNGTKFVFRNNKYVIETKEE